MTAAGAYSFQFCGDCLGDLVPNGSQLMVDPAQEIRPMDVVAIVLKPGLEGPFAHFVNSIGDGGFMGVCKIFLGTHELRSGETVYRVAQLNPPIVSPIPASAIEALHCVVDGEFSRETRSSASDLAAIELLAPFANGESRSPINPTKAMEIA